MEGHVSLTISKLALSSITLSAKSVAKNGNAETDLVLTKEEDAIPGSVSGYDSKTGTLTLSTDKDYPGIPRDLSIPAKYLDTVFFAEQNRKDDSRSPARHSLQMKDGSRLHGDILSMDSLNIILRHPQLGQISLPLKNITRGIPESRPAIPFHSLIDPAMKQAITLFLCACALPTALLLPHARAEGVITLKSGEKLPGSMDTMNRPYLKIRSSILSKPVDVHMGELDELASSRPLEIPEQFSIIRLANGDEVYGTLKALDAENLQLQTAWGGLLQVDRKYVRHIGFDSQKAYLRNATESLQGWESSAKSTLPECRNGYWLMRGSNNTELQTSFPMPPRLHVQFSLYHTNTFRINLALWKDSESGNSINLDLSLEKAELSKTSSGQYRTLGRVKRNTERNWYADKSVKRSDVHFYADPEKGNYYLYVNGEQVARWEEVKEMDTIFENESGDDEGEDGESAGKHEFKPGNTLALGGYDSLNMAVFHLNVFDWNGAIPHLEEELDIISRYDPTAPRDKALLVNGDVLRGAISLQEEGSIRIKSDHYDVTVPTARVRALDQKGHEEKDLPEDSSDTRVFLTDQSVLSLALETIRNGVMEGRSSAVGKVRIPLQSVRKVQFNLQNPELRKQRETPFRCK